MHLIGGILIVLLVFWLARRLTGSNGVGAGAAGVAAIALLLLGSGHHHRDS